MRPSIMMGCAAVCALLLTASGQSKEPSAKQTIAVWTTKFRMPDPPEISPPPPPYYAIDHMSLSVSGNKLIRKNVSGDSGDRIDVDTVALSRITSIVADDWVWEAMPGAPRVHRIGIKTKTENDISEFSHYPKSMHMPDSLTHSGNLPGFAVFAPDQLSQRDEAYKRICAMVDKSVCSVASMQR